MQLYLRYHTAGQPWDKGQAAQVSLPRHCRAMLASHPRTARCGMQVAASHHSSMVISLAGGQVCEISRRR